MTRKSQHYKYCFVNCCINLFHIMCVVYHILKGNYRDSYTAVYGVSNKCILIKTNEKSVNIEVNITRLDICLE